MKLASICARLLDGWRFDSTYEGLKRTARACDELGDACFDSTYEGLKLALCCVAPVTDQGFDSTYEGLKQAPPQLSREGVTWFRQYL